MAETRDVVIIGGGHNGLVTAFYLAKAGFKPLLLERRAAVGGCAITEEFHPGFRCSRLAHSCRADSSRNCRRHGPGEPRAEDLHARCPRAVAGADREAPGAVPRHRRGRSRRSRSFRRKMRPATRSSRERWRSIGGVIDHLMTMTPPDLDDPASGNLWELLKTGRKIRGLGEKDLVPPAALGADGGCRPGRGMVRERIAARHHRRAGYLRHVSGTMVGRLERPAVARRLRRQSCGRGFLRHGRRRARSRKRWPPRCKAAGAEIRTNCEVAQHQGERWAAPESSCASGEEIDARAVVSNADPKRTLLGLVRSATSGNPASCRSCSITA